MGCDGEGSNWHPGAAAPVWDPCMVCGGKGVMNCTGCNGKGSLRERPRDVEPALGSRQIAGAAHMYANTPGLLIGEEEKPAILPIVVGITCFIILLLLILYAVTLSALS